MRRTFWLLVGYVVFRTWPDICDVFEMDDEVIM